MTITDAVAKKALKALTNSHWSARHHSRLDRLRNALPGSVSPAAFGWWAFKSNKYDVAYDADLMSEMTRAKGEFSAADASLLLRRMVRPGSDEMRAGYFATHVSTWPDWADTLVETLGRDAHALRADLAAMPGLLKVGLALSLAMRGFLEREQVPPEAAREVARLTIEQDPAQTKRAREYLFGEAPDAEWAALLDYAQDAPHVSAACYAFLAREAPSDVLAWVTYHAGEVQYTGARAAADMASKRGASLRGPLEACGDRLLSDASERTPARTQWLVLSLLAVLEPDDELLPVRFDPLLAYCLGDAPNAADHAWWSRTRADPEAPFWRRTLGSLPTERAEAVLLTAMHATRPVGARTISARLLDTFWVAPTERVVECLLEALAAWDGSATYDMIDVVLQSFVAWGRASLPHLERAATRFPARGAFFKRIARRVEAVADE